MTKRWFSNAVQHERHNLTKPDAPELIVLDTARIVRALDQALRTHPTMNWEVSEVLQFILATITYEGRARTDLEYGCLDLVREVQQTDLAEDVQRAITGVAHLGQELIAQLKSIQAYHNGYLFYGFHSLLGDDLVLVRLFLDKYPDHYHGHQ